MTESSHFAGNDLLASSSAMQEADNYQRWTFALCEPHLHGRVLEVGCGVGSFSARIGAHPRVDSLLSIDASETALARCRERNPSPDVEFRRADLFDVEGRFDSIVCMHVIEHIEDDVAALRHMLGLLEPGGALFLIVPAHGWLFSRFDAAVGHHRRYTKRSLAECVERLGGSPTARLEEARYYNSVAALGYFLMYRVLGREQVGGEVGIFDRVVAPILERFEPRWVPFGIALTGVIRRA